MKNIILVTGLSALFTLAGAVYAAGDAEQGKEKSSSCSGCHGSMGEGTSSAPKLAGLKQTHIVKQLQDFKSGARPSSMMGMFAKPLADSDIEDIAAYYSTIQ